MESSDYEFIMSSQQFISTVFQKSEPNSPQHSKSTHRKISNSEKGSPIKQPIQLRRTKCQKITYDSKPISIGSYQDKFFAMEPYQSEIYLPNEAPKINNNKMMPISTSPWVSNSKRVQSKWTLRKGNSSDQAFSKHRSSQYQFGQEGFSDLKDYIHSVKYFFMQHKRKVDHQRRNRVQMMNQVRTNLEEKGNLNIIKLKPSSHHKRRQTLQAEKDPSHHLNGYSSTNHLATSSPSKTSFSGKISLSGNQSSKIFRRKGPAKKDYHFIFGEFKQQMTEEAAQKLRCLYYRDFLWKISFNRNFTFESSTQVHRYFVGKGNNSRLIRRIMAKRSWWVEESKQENAHFVWTQLKVYDVYKNQRSQKRKTHSKLMLCQSDTLGQSTVLFTAPCVKAGQTASREVHVKEASAPVDKNRFILNKQKYLKWRAYISSKGGAERNATEDMKQRKLEQLEVKKINHKITNHLEYSRVIGNKKALYKTMQTYFDIKGKDNDYIPLTFHITGGIENQEYLTFLREFYKKSKDGLTWWIVKPGQLSNRGKDIKFCSSLQAIKQQIKQKKLNPNGSPRTYIVQSYIHKPFLYQGRKFDLRHYLMITSTEGVLRGYFYQEGYVRTTSYTYSLNSSNAGVHLTNDAVQKYLPQYSKYEKANKLSYQQLNEYMLKINPARGFYEVIFPQLKKIGTEIIEAAFPFVDPERRANNFEVFGIDVMIDEDYKCWLIEVNTNPCIEVNCPVLAAVIPTMLDNALTIGVDSLVTPPLGKSKAAFANYLFENKFQLIFDEQTQGWEYQPENTDIFNYGDDDDNYESCEQDDYDV